MTNNNQNEESENLSETMKQELLDFLPDALRTLLCAYCIFSDQEVSQDSKEFKSYQEACKSAISNIENLTKLANWADLLGDGADDEDRQAELISLMIQAKSEVIEFHKKINKNDD